MNARKFVMLAAGREFRIPNGGWSSEDFKANGVPLIKAFNRVASIVRAKIGSAIAQKTRTHIASFADRVCAAVGDWKTGGKAKPAGAYGGPSGEASNLKVEFDRAINEVYMGISKEFRDLIEKDVRSGVGQGYSKSNLLLGKKDRKKDLKKLDKKAKRILKASDTVTETTKNEMHAFVEKMQDEGYTKKEAVSIFRQKMHERAQRRSLLSGRCVSTRCWHDGSFLAMAKAGVRSVDVIGCMSREQDRWEQPSFQPYMFDADGREPEGTCNIKRVPIEFADELEWHPNHTGTAVPSSFRRKEIGGKAYDPREPRNDQGEWTSASNATLTRQERAKLHHKPATLEKQRIAEAQEPKVAKAVSGTQTDDNDPVDVIKSGHGIEVKSIVEGKNPKITMHPESLARKKKFARKNKAKLHTVVIDMREGKPVVYYRKGVGSFRLTSMEKLVSFAELKGKFE
ncbi:hypothetical protein CCP3SC15_4920001 [Gammaproteobacteria bacterium]